MIHGHGGNILEAAERLACSPGDIIDMSSNINPLGPMPGLLEHLKNSMDRVCALPQVDAARAVSTYADWQGIAPNRVLAGAGTTQFLYQIPKALKITSAVIVAPTYADYADALAMHNIPFRYFLLDEEKEYAPDPDLLAKAAGKTDTVFFCNPNNPTGRYTATDDLEHLAKSCPDTLFVIDESYLPFVNDCGDDSIAYRRLPNVIVFQSLSKMFCIPGLRVGFCVAPAALSEKIAGYSTPWAVNSLAQAAVSYIADNADHAATHIKNTRKYLVNERAAFYESISGGSPLKMFSSQATFILLKLSGFCSADLVRHMLGYRFLLRDCSNFVGLSDRFVRVSLKKPDDNRQAADLIQAFIQRHAGDSRRCVTK